MRRLFLLVVLSFWCGGCASSRGTAGGAPPAEPRERDSVSVDEPSYFIDSRTASRAEVEQLAAGRIVQVAVLKGPEAMVRYGIAGRHGVVLVTTTSAEPPATQQGATSRDMFYFVDGRTASAAHVTNLSRDVIERVEILKGLPAAALYGSEARAGVVLVATKRAP